MEENLESALVSNVAIKSLHEDLEEQGPTDESNLVEKIDASQHFSDLFGDDEPPDNSEGQAASSRESGSDSDSDSSDSGSDSGSRSRSRSPAGTASGSGSDSENDSSSNSKDGSDVEIDILNDDDKEPKKLHADEQGLCRAAVPWSMPDAGLLQEGNLRDQEGYASEDIDIDKDSLGDNEAELAPVSHAPAISTEKLKTVSPEHVQSLLHGVADMRNEPEDVEEEFKHEQPDSLMRFKGKPKRGFEASQFEESSVHFKRHQSGSMAQSSMSGYMQGISPRSSPDITNEDHQENHNLQVSDSYDRNDTSNLGGQGGYNHPVSGKFSPDLLRSVRRPPIRSHDTEPADKVGKVPRSRGLDVKHQETNAFKREGLLNWGDKGRKEMRDGESTLNEKINGKSKAGAFDKKQDTRAEPHYGKHGEEGEKSLTLGNSSRLQLGSSPKDGGQVDFDRDSVDKRRLQRELSDLELGELRDPLPEEPDIPKKQFERVGSFKQSDSKSSTSGSQNADFRGAGKPTADTGKPTADTGSPSLPESRAGGLKNVNNWSKRRSPEPSAEDFSRPSHQTLESHQQLPRGARTEVGSLLSKAADVNSLRANEGALNEGADVEGYGESQKKSHASAQLEESKQDTGARKVKGSKSLKSNKLTDASDRRKDASSTEGHNGKRKRSGSSLDEDVSYSKYEKKEPELKGPVKNFSQ